MKLGEIYKLAVRMGIEKDPRGKAEIKRLLARNKEKYESLPEKERQYFDAGGLENPFPDSRILVGDPSTEVKSALVGVDMEVPEVLLSGDHARINAWRHEAAVQRTRERRPDLLGE